MSMLADLPQSVWSGVHLKYLTGADAKPKTVFIVGGFAIYMGCILGTGLLLQSKSVKNALKPYKIQSSASPGPELMDLLASHSIQGVLGQIPAMYALYHVFNRCGYTMDEQLPSAGRVLSRVALWHVLFDAWFYWTHRACHEFPALYKHVHSQHHRFKSPIGLAASYAHPAEELVVNFGSTLVGPLLFPCHVVTWWVYFLVRGFETVEVHSGYDVPWSFWKLPPMNLIHGGSSRHDFHHSHVNKGCYGGFVWWDYFMGTDVEWRKHRAAGGK